MTENRPNRSDKANTNASWVSTDRYRDNYDRIFSNSKPSNRQYFVKVVNFETKEVFHGKTKRLPELGEGFDILMEPMILKRFGKILDTDKIDQDCHEFTSIQGQFILFIKEFL